MDNQQQPKIKVMAAKHGIAWLAQSFALIRAQPARLLFLVVLLQLILGLTQLPLVGVFIVMAMPALSAGLLQAFRLVASGQRPAMATLFVPLASAPRSGRLLLLGVLMIAAGILSVSLILSGTADLLDADLLARIEQGDMEAMTLLDPAIIRRAFIAMAVGISISGTLSFLAIPLLWFSELKLGTALISGLRAMFLNWRPFTMLALGLFALLVPVAVVIAILFQIAGSSGGLSIILLGLIMLIALVFQLIVFGTQFCSYREIYGLDSDVAGSDAGTAGDHQLLA